MAAAAPATHRPKDRSVACLYKVKPRLWRLDVFPFALAYSVLWAGALAPLLEEQEQSGGKGSGSSGGGAIPFWVLVCMPVALLLHVLTHLSTHWAVACDALVAYTKVKTMAEASHVRVRPPPNSGSEELVPLVLEEEATTQEEDGDDSNHAPVTIVGKDFCWPHARFSFQKAVFCYWAPHATAAEFSRLAYPTEGLVQQFLQQKGYGDPNELSRARALWGENVFDIPLPPFGELFRVRTDGWWWWVKRSKQ